MRLAAPGGGVLNGYHVFGLRAFLAADFRKADGLPFGQSLEALAYNGTEMHEQVDTVGALDEAEAFAFVEPLDGSSLLLRHKCTFKLDKMRETYSMIPNGSSKNGGVLREGGQLKQE